MAMINAMNALKYENKVRLIDMMEVPLLTAEAQKRSRAQCVFDPMRGSARLSLDTIRAEPKENKAFQLQQALTMFVQSNRMKIEARSSPKERGARERFAFTCRAVLESTVAACGKLRGPL